MVIGAGRFDGHAAQERMIQVRCFQPGNVGRNLEQRLQHRQNTAHNRRCDNSVADGKSALQSNHSPIVRRGREKTNWTNVTKGEGQNPNCDADTQPGANELAAATDLQRQINSSESADHSGNEQRRVNFSKENTAPKTDENGRVETVVAAEQDTEQ